MSKAHVVDFRGWVDTKEVLGEGFVDTSERDLRPDEILQHEKDAQEFELRKAARNERRKREAIKSELLDTMVDEEIAKRGVIL